MQNLTANRQNEINLSTRISRTDAEAFAAHAESRGRTLAGELRFLVRQAIESNEKTA
jgi:hypothetical protein